MIEVAGGILLAVLVLVLLPWIIIGAVWCAAALAVIAAIVAGIMNPEIGITELIFVAIVGIYYLGNTNVATFHLPIIPIEEAHKIIRDHAEAHGCTFRISADDEVSYYGPRPKSSEPSWSFVGYGAETVARRIKSGASMQNLLESALRSDA